MNTSDAWPVAWNEWVRFWCSLRSQQRQSFRAASSIISSTTVSLRKLSGNVFAIRRSTDLSQAIVTAQSWRDDKWYGYLLSEEGWNNIFSEKDKMMPRLSCQILLLVVSVLKYFLLYLRVCDICLDGKNPNQLTLWGTWQASVSWHCMRIELSAVIITLRIRIRTGNKFLGHLFCSS